MPIELILRANIHSFTPSLPPHQPIYSLISCSAYPSYHPLKKQERARKKRERKQKRGKSHFECKMEKYLLYVPVSMKHNLMISSIEN